VDLGKVRFCIAQLILLHSHYRCFLTGDYAWDRTSQAALSLPHYGRSPIGLRFAYHKAQRAGEGFVEVQERMKHTLYERPGPYLGALSVMGH
jgi:hypothetical protein